MMVRWEPLRELSELQERVNRMFDRTDRGRPARPAARPVRNVWTPAVDIFETGEALVLEVDVPGLDQKEVHLEIDGGVLTLKGERREGLEEKTEGYVRVERPHGSFERSFSLPSGVEKDAIKARLKNGVLRVELPKAAGAKRHPVEIETP